jgi:hypothetical protein
MINNEYKGNDIIGGASVNTTSTHQKHPNRNDNNSSSSISSLIEDIRQSDFQEHNLLIYPDLPSFTQHAQNKHLITMKLLLSLLHMIHLTE